jgi:hypothetical protein
MILPQEIPTLTKTPRSDESCRTEFNLTIRHCRHQVDSRAESNGKSTIIKFCVQILGSFDAASLPCKAKALYPEKYSKIACRMIAHGKPGATRRLISTGRRIKFL